MKKLLIFCILQVALLNAYTLVLNDNSFVKGELVYIADTYTLMNVDGKPKKISNSIIKKRFYTAEELAAIEKKKQQETARQEEIIRQEEIAKQKVVKQEAVAMQEEQTYMMTVTKEEPTGTFTTVAPKTSKINLYVNLDIAGYLNGSSLSKLGDSFNSSDKQDMVFGFGGEYNDILFGETRYTLGALLQLERSFSGSGKYSGNNLYARIEHPFDPKKKNNYLGFELNLFNANISGLSSIFTNVSYTPKMGFAVYERSYFDKGFVEMGIRRVAVIMNWIDSIYGDNWETTFDSTGLYFLVGMTF